LSNLELADITNVPADAANSTSAFQSEDILVLGYYSHSNDNILVVEPGGVDLHFYFVVIQR
jgi:hypothetical protein